MKTTYASLAELEDALGSFTEADTVYSHLARVQKLSWGDFLCSVLFRRWLMDIVYGRREAGDNDYDRTAVLISRLPGLEDSGSLPGRGWNTYEDTYPGRFINMRTLKHEIMQVHFPPGKKTINLGIPPGSSPKTNLKL